MDARTATPVVLVHDWLTGMRGGEKCLEVLCQRWPNAPLYTLLHHPGSVASLIEERAIRSSFLHYLPGVHHYYRYLLPLMPAAVASLRLPSCQMVVSLSHCVAKAVQPPRQAAHVCYCFTPMRYAWHMRQAYFAESPRAWSSRLRDRLLDALRCWDRRTAERVTHFIAISRTVRQRIAECYDRDSVVIYPPVDTDYFHPSLRRRADYYLAVSAFAPYKRLDLAIAACNRLRKHLVIIGMGPEEKRLRALAGPTIHFLGWQPDEIVREQLRTCKALLFPGEEDFGIVPVEAQACGTPVIAYGQGGATETVVPPGGTREPTGIWFEEQTAENLIAAIEEFEASCSHFNPHAARRQALHFNRHRFATELFGYLDSIRETALPSEQRHAA
ncbi:MAG: glycosyltransferase [Gemmataceae bacterium]